MDSVDKSWVLFVLVCVLGAATCKVSGDRRDVEIKRIEAQQKCGQQTGAKP